LGDSALAVDIIVALIKTLGLTELVSDALASRKQKETETNAKIVDLFKEALDEIIRDLICVYEFRIYFYLIVTRLSKLRYVLNESCICQSGHGIIETDLAIPILIAYSGHETRAGYCKCQMIREFLSYRRFTVYPDEYFVNFYDMQLIYYPPTLNFS
jgi:hypothetical protein